MLTELGTQLGAMVLALDLDQWGDFLVIAVMAILWLIGGLAKVLTSRKGSKPQDQREGAAKQPRQRQTWQERLTRKAEEMQRAAEAKSRQLEQQVRGQTSQPRPSPAGGVTIRADRKGDSVMVYERPAPQLAVERDSQAARERQAREAVLAARQKAATQAYLEPQIELGSPGSLSLEPADIRLETSGEPAGFQPADVIDYSDPDALSKAILHYEILGKPLALRESPDETNAF